MAFVGSFGGSSKTSRSTVDRRRTCVCVQPAPFGSQLVDFVFLFGGLGLVVGAGFLLKNGFEADITTGPNRTESVNLPRIREYNPTVAEAEIRSDEKDEEQ